MAISDKNIPSAAPSSSTAPTLESLMAEIEALKKRVYALENFDIECNSYGEMTITKYKGNLSSVVIPDGVVNIGARAFCDCKHLKEIYIPDSVEYIGNFAFGRTSLTEATVSASCYVLPNAFPFSIKQVKRR